MINDKKMELLKKLYALAERGDRGEKEVARSRLDELMQKYGVTEEELSDDVLEIHWFTCENEQVKKLFDQVCYKVNKDRDVYIKRKGTGKRSARGVECTKAEAIQIEYEFEFYRKLWREECDFFFSAFVQKHRIFDMTPGHKTENALTDGDILRMRMMVNAMQDREMHLALEE